MATVQVPSRLSFAGPLRAGQTVEARWIAGHPMETGFRLDDSGRPIQRNVITQVRVLLNGQMILDIEPGTGMSANPYLAFPVTDPPMAARCRWSGWTTPGAATAQCRS